MRIKTKGMLRGLILGGVAILLAACGGGGGGGNDGWNGIDINNKYKVTLTATKTALPQNIENIPPWSADVCAALRIRNNCADARAGGAYHSVIYVKAFRDNSKDPIPNGEKTFACNMDAGLDVGSLYYLNGSEEDLSLEVDIVDAEGKVTKKKVSAAYRSIVLGSSAGGSSFHFVSKKDVGTATIRCSVNDPQSNTQAYADIKINVGGGSTSKGSDIYLSHVGNNYMYAQNYGGINATTQGIVQVRVLDEANQPVADPAKDAYNLVAWIDTERSGKAAIGAKLRSGSFAGQSVVAKTINGQAQFTIVSGPNPGLLVIRFQSDRTDNNVMNGISEPIYNVAGFYVVDYFPSGPLEIQPVSVEPDSYNLPTANINTSYAYMFEAKGGAPSYSWKEVGATLAQYGLTLNTDGTLFGTPIMTVENASVRIMVTDARGVTDTKVFTLTITSTPSGTLAITSGVPAAGTIDVPYAAILTAEGGNPPYTWSGSTTAPGLTVNADGSITGTPTKQGDFSATLTVTDARGLTATKTVVIKIGAVVVVPPGGALTITTATLTVAAGGSGTVAASGGTAPYSWFLMSVSPGFTISAAGVLQVGAGVTPGVHNIAVKVTDAVSATTTGFVNVTVTP